MLYLVSYDIPSTRAGNRRRVKVAKFLEGIALRVQLSVFELDIDPQKLGSVVAALEEKLDLEQDSIRVYPLCGTCAGKIQRLGIEAPVEAGTLMIW